MPWPVHRRPFHRVIERWREVAVGLPDRRTGDNRCYAMADIALSAFAVFFTQSPSFLSFHQNLERARDLNNARSLFQVQAIPSDNHIRQTLDPVEARHLFSLFDEVQGAFEQAGVLEVMRAVGHTRLIALDATWYFSSQAQNLHCRNCSCLHHPGGQTTHFHSAITPVIVSPGPAQVVSLRPEFITSQDGSVKQDCEINAAKRWLAAHTQRYATGNDTLLGDDLYAHQPFCRQVLLHGFHFLFPCKPASHPCLRQWVETLAPGRPPHLEVADQSPTDRWKYHHYRWALGVPLADAEGAVRYRNVFITHGPITADNVAALEAAARARWKIENEHNNVLKTKGFTWSTTSVTASSTWPAYC